ncbi:MAG: translational GTPase TypA [Candidatus Absconditabacteria bacterium]
MSVRNIAIIAHVDHGKTTLVDSLLKQSGATKFEDGQKCVMDSNDQEKERGITIYSKNTSVVYKDNIINIIDTPGHADFGSEVERVLRMVDSVLLLVDAYEGPMPQTKFVLKKSLELGLKPIVVINKIDKPTSRPNIVIDRVFDLFAQLGATNEQLDFPIIYTIAKQGIAIRELEDEHVDISPLFELVLEKVPAAPFVPEKPFRMQVANLDYNDYFGRLGIGRIYEGTVKKGQSVNIVGNDGKVRSGKISKIFVTRGLSRVEVNEGTCGDIVVIAGIPDIYVGETVGVGEVTPMPGIKIDEPTMIMDFMVNDSPFAGREGKYVTSRNIKERLEKELEMNVGLKIDFADKSRFIVSGRGELHLSVLIETMRREGFELQVSAPQVIYRYENGNKLEPIEALVVNVAENLAGTVIEALSNRKGMLQNMICENGIAQIEFFIPTRGMLGFRSWFVLNTKGEGICYSSFSHYDEYKGEIPKREVGSMIACQSGKAMKYSIWKLQERGPVFVEPATDIYEGMIVGEYSKGGDLMVNLTKNKQLTNVRESGNDEAMRLDPIIKLTLEDALSYIGPGELVEITPNTFRLRKQYLTESDRKLAQKKEKEKRSNENN